MIAFGMGNNLLTFINKYYKYNGKREIEDKGLTIGSYKSTWLADLVAAFIGCSCTSIQQLMNNSRNLPSAGTLRYMDVILILLTL
jgi:uncharacterized protein YcsI (UPF0317 family)